ncbi:ribosome biogenesis GTPase Der [Candidatus Uhrbacteria bacterium]|nr:ribosome biogenesis GTPase Der [Candidatus Uhrbacteria bacterium]MBD3283917.1 ribosome biogenesis GTPase Der [Candidatus Uhrbacteria bacterium]
MADQNIKLDQLPVVSIIGRANVGKSTLWNKLVERHRALISDAPHTTRDRNFATAVWRGKTFRVVDTGGMDTEDNTIGKGIRRQAELAIKKSDVILFLVDGKNGVLDVDRDLAKYIRKHAKHALLVVNKIDQPKDLNIASDQGIYGLGYKELLPISAATGKGVGDLLDRVYEELEAMGKPAPDSETVQEEEEEEERPIRIVIMGRPNAGKSSLTNAILGEERVIVSEIAHTTREPQDTSLTYKDQEIVLVDTAGMRKRSNVKRGLETAGLQRNKEALERADIAFLVFDATEDPTFQDKYLAGLMKEESKGLVLVANKWDLVPDKTTKSAKEYEQKIRQAFPFLDWAPMVFTSAKTGKRAKDLLDLALKIQTERKRIIDYNAINRLLKTVIKQKRPLQVLGPKSPYIYDMAQTRTEPPTFLVTIRGKKQSVHISWLKFLQRKIREKFGFQGTPIIVRATNVPMAKSERSWNVRGPGMEAVTESDDETTSDETT